MNLSSDPDDKLKIYRENFERSYIDSTEAFYRIKAMQYLNDNGVQNYMKFAFSKLKEEELRAKKYLEPSSTSIQAVSREFYSTKIILINRTKFQLMDCCVEVLVTTFKDTILAECPGMIKNNETESTLIILLRFPPSYQSSVPTFCSLFTELQLMFKLMDRVPDGINSMLKDLEEHIIAAGLDDMKQVAEIITQDSEKYVERLLELFNRFSSLVASAFLDDPRFLTSRDKAYKEVVNDTKVFRLELPVSKQVYHGFGYIS